MRENYEAVARRIGISGATSDDLTPLHGGLHGLQPPLQLDHNARQLLERYARRRESFKSRGVYLGQSMLACLSQAQDDRRASQQVSSGDPLRIASWALLMA